MSVRCSWARRFRAILLLRSRVCFSDQIFVIRSSRVVLGPVHLRISETASYNADVDADQLLLPTRKYILARSQGLQPASSSIKLYKINDIF